MSDNELEHMLKLIENFDNAMLVTRREGELRSRPMAIGDYTKDGRIRFITRDDSAKLAELDDDSHVNVAMQGDDKFLSISGRARLTKDRELIDATWSVSQAPWFSEGKDDPHVIVLEVIPTHGEYWDSEAGNVLKLAVARVRGEDERADDDLHGDVDFDDRPL